MNALFYFADMKYWMLFFFLSSINASGQNRIVKSKMDSILFEIASNYRISDIGVKNVSELELGTFIIDGKIMMPDSVARKAYIPFTNVYCRRINGIISTLYFVLSKADSAVTGTLTKKYGEPTTTFGALIEDSKVHNESKNMIWRFQDHSVFYYPLGYGRLKLLIFNNHPEATFFKDYEKLKGLTP